MLKIIGAMLVILGSTGFGAACRQEMVQTLQHTVCLQEILDLIKSEVEYSKSSLPEACRMAGVKTAEPYRSALLHVAEQMRENAGISFPKVWEQEMKHCLAKLAVKKKDRELFLRFAQSTGYADRQMQLRALEQYSMLLKQSVEAQREELLKKGRVVMSMGLISGVFLTIVLL